MRRAVARWRARSRDLGDQWRTWRSEWQVERDLERAIDGDGPIIAGPWCSEVGYEVLYWVPFLRWVMTAYRVDPARVVTLSRGGTESWYRGIAGRYAEVFDYVAPSELATRARAGDLKQKAISDFDRQLIERVIAAEPGTRNPERGTRVRVLHPSLMFRWFAPFWSGHETMSFVERHTRYVRLDAADLSADLSAGSARLAGRRASAGCRLAERADVAEAEASLSGSEAKAELSPWPLPSEYVAVKLYSARSLPDEPAVRAQLRALLSRLAERWPIVQLDTGLGVDDHADYDFAAGGRIVSVSGRLEARTNLAAQTRIIAGARLFVGTCGSLAWLAPLLGVPTVALFTDDSFLHAHLHLARRVYGRTGAAAFSPLDLSGLIEAGLSIGQSSAFAEASASAKASAFAEASADRSADKSADKHSSPKVTVS